MARVDEALQPEAVRTIAGTILQVVPVFFLSLFVADRRGLVDALQRKKPGQPSDQRRRNRHTLVNVQFHFLSGALLAVAGALAALVSGHPAALVLAVPGFASTLYVFLLLVMFLVRDYSLSQLGLREHHARHDSGEKFLGLFWLDRGRPPSWTQEEKFKHRSWSRLVLLTLVCWLTAVVALGVSVSWTLKHAF